MRIKADSKQVKANRVLRTSAVAASAESAVREPPPDTWPVRMPPYAYTSLCPDPGLRRPPEGSDDTWHQDQFIMTCTIVADMTVGTERRS